MPFALLVIGVIILISAIRNTHKQLGAQLVKDFTGSGSFLVWIAAIAIIGMLGYIPKFETPSRAFLGLILLAMFLSNKGFFTQFNAAIRGGPAQVQATQEPTINGPAPVKLIGGSGGSGGLGGILGAATKLAGAV